MRSAIRRVMIVDDDAVTLEVLTGLLEAQGYQVTTRPQAKGTTALLMTEPHDLLILDVNMPGLAGDGLLRALEKNAKIGFEMPAVILHSALPVEQVERIAAEGGALGIIPKGDARDFVGQLEAILARLPTA